MAELDSILSGKGAVASNPEPEKEIVTEGQQPEPNTEPAPEGQPEEGTENQSMVPHAALHAEKQKVKRYTEQVAEFQTKLAEQNTAWERRFEQLLAKVGSPQQPAQEEPKAPDFWEDPDGYLKGALTPVQQQIQQQREQFSLLMAQDKHGADTVNAAYEALKAELVSNPASRAEYQAIMQAPHPYGALVEWHTKRQAAAEIGNDPAAYREKLKAEILAEMQAQQPEPASAAIAPVMPTNLAGARNAGNRSGPAWGGPQPLNDIFNRAHKTG